MSRNHILGRSCGTGGPGDASGPGSVPRPNSVSADRAGRDGAVGPLVDEDERARGAVHLQCGRSRLGLQRLHVDAVVDALELGAYGVDALPQQIRTGSSAPVPCRTQQTSATISWDTRAVLFTDENRSPRDTSISRSRRTVTARSAWRLAHGAIRGQDLGNDGRVLAALTAVVDRSGVPGTLVGCSGLLDGAPGCTLMA